MNIHSAIELIASAGNGIAADFTELKRLYKRAALACHPDRVNSNESSVSMKTLNEAWDFVSGKVELVNYTLNGTSNNVRTAKVNDPIESHELTHSNLPAFASRETLIREAFMIIDDEKWNNWTDVRFKTVYFSKYQVRVHTYSSSIHITTLANALEARKTCEKYTIHWNVGSDAEGYSRFLEWVRNISQTECITGVIAHLYIANYQERRDGVFEAELMPGLTVTRREVKSGQVFSPFKLHKLKPLTEIPEKVRALHLIKMLANGQYRQLHRKSYLTDDYAYDAANNHGAKVYENPFPLLADLIEDRSEGFHFFHSGHGVYSFGDHMNDSKSIVPVIDNRFPAVDLISTKLNEQAYLQ